MISAKNLFLMTLFLSVIMSCKNRNSGTAEDSGSPKVSVRIAVITNGNIDEIVSLNGKSVYLKKNNVISSLPGYLKKVYVQYGDMVHKNELLFEIQTKENKALENSNLDPELSSSINGVIKILSPADGTISDLNINSSGMYIAEGSQLCTIVEHNEMMVQVNVPYEYNQWIQINRECKIVLPDSTFLDGNIFKIMPVINESSQTQNVLIKVRNNRPVPENLNVIVRIVKFSHSKALLIPKEALLTNEIQKEFWVMKILHDSVALKVPVKKGFENNRMVEIISANITVNDHVIIEGAYGLPDNTIVKVVK
jgi:multidrug efflux pump subunit AcrA (membrane-fusion protein)